HRQWSSAGRVVAQRLPRTGIPRPGFVGRSGNALELGDVFQDSTDLAGEGLEGLLVHGERGEPGDLLDLRLGDAHAPSESRSRPAYATSSCRVPISVS